MKLENKDLRIKILDMITSAKEGHIPSSFSIVDIINFLYSEILDVKKIKSNSLARDYFVLSKGHGCAALYVVLNKFKILNKKHINSYGKKNSIIGGHPDFSKVPGVEASTGSLGHGFPTAVGIALGCKIKKKKNKIFVLLGDGECQEGTVWESANIANNRELDNLIAIVDWNGSAEQLMPKDDLINKWKSFGWKTFIANGHSNSSLRSSFKKAFRQKKKPCVILAKCTKGKSLKMIEGHGRWHHKIPNQNEYKIIKDFLNK